MALVAKLDIGNEVTDIIVVDDSIQNKEQWCTNLLKGTWKEISDGQEVAIGSIYDSEKNAFLAVQPFSSWTLDNNNKWQPPVAFPTIIINTNATPIALQGSIDPDGNTVANDVYPTYKIVWSENNLRWESFNENNQNIHWDPSSSSWVNS
jgi:hypothetical protein